MPTKGIYIYGIVPNFYSTDMFRSLDDTKVYAIPYENISAIVSDRDSVSLDSLDRESLGHLLVHHQKTIEELQNKEFAMILPMRLGTIVSSKKEVIKILANGHSLMVEALKKIEFLSEIDLAVTWADFATTIKELAGQPEIVALKEEILNSTDNPSQVDQVKIGMLLHEMLDEKNKKIELNILDSLSSMCSDIKTHEVMNDQMITNSAFLIDRKKKDKFEQLIEILDELYSGMLNFKLVGPLPCYSFYTIEVKELSAELVIQAKIELGLAEETSESEIKRAYLKKAKEFHPDSHQNNGDQDNFNKINKAYHTLNEYSESVRQILKEGLISFNQEKLQDNLLLVKIKE